MDADVDLKLITMKQQEDYTLQYCMFPSVTIYSMVGNPFIVNIFALEFFFGHVYPKVVLPMILWSCNLLLLDVLPNFFVVLTFLIFFKHTHTF